MPPDSLFSASRQQRSLIAAGVKLKKGDSKHFGGNLLNQKI